VRRVRQFQLQIVAFVGSAIVAAMIGVFNFLARIAYETLY
jgi:uncharacterized membrane protein YuzA (DUF378 family)